MRTLTLAAVAFLALTARSIPQPEPEPEVEPEPEHEPHEPHPKPENSTMSPEKLAGMIMERMGMRDDLMNMFQYHMGQAQEVVGSIVREGPSPEKAMQLVMNVMELFVDFNDLTGMSPERMMSGGMMPGMMVTGGMMPSGGTMMMDCKPVMKMAIMTALKNRGLQSFMSVAMMTGLVLKLQNMPGPFTVFVASEEAVMNHPQHMSDMMKSPKLMKRTIKYHIVPRMLKAADIKDGMKVMTMIREPLMFSVTEAGVSINGGQAMVLEADIEADNGCIHIIDNILTPPPMQEPTMNLAELASSKGLTTLVSLLEAAGLADTIANGEVFTIFAPSNEAFDKVPEEIMNKLAADPKLLTSVLTYHVVPDKIKTNTLDKLQMPKFLVNTVADIAIGLTSSKMGYRRYGMAKALKVHGFNWTSVNHEATNGIIHVIDGVMIPPMKSLLEMVQEDPELTTFLAAVKAAGMEEMLTKRPATIAVKAPTNAAFEKLPEGALDGLLADLPALRELLSLHIKDNSHMVKKFGPVMKGPIRRMLETMMHVQGSAESHSAEEKGGMKKNYSSEEKGGMKKKVLKAKKAMKKVKATNGMFYKIDHVIM